MAGCHVAMNLAADAEGLWTMPRAQAMDRLLVVYADLAKQAASERAGQNHHIVRDDYECSAMMGLWKAAERFDPNNESSAAFSTYAMMRIWGCMFDRERENDVVSSKTRSREKAGKIPPLPLLFSIHREAKDSVAAIPCRPDDSVAAADTTDELNVVLDGADPDAAEVLRLAMALNFDLCELGEQLGGDFNHGVACYDAARRSVRSGEPFIKPTLKPPGSRRRWPWRDAEFGRPVAPG